MGTVDINIKALFLVISEADHQLYNYIIMKTFEELGVNEPLRKAVEELGFESPMPVQERVIPRLLGDAHDIIALAQTGTGKRRHSGCRCCNALTPTSTGLRP